MSAKSAGKPDVVSANNYYILRSKRGIPRRVFVRTVSPCGRYCLVTYSVSGTKQHQCLASELEVDPVDVEKLRVS